MESLEIETLERWWIQIIKHGARSPLTSHCRVWRGWEGVGLGLVLDSGSVKELLHKRTQEWINLYWKLSGKLDQIYWDDGIIKLFDVCLMFTCSDSKIQSFSLPPHPSPPKACFWTSSLFCLLVNKHQIPLPFQRLETPFTSQFEYYLAHLPPKLYFKEYQLLNDSMSHSPFFSFSHAAPTVHTATPFLKASISVPIFTPMQWSLVRDTIVCNIPFLAPSSHSLITISDFSTSIPPFP